MPSISESDVTINGLRIGRISVQDVMATPGPIPRVLFRIGLTLREPSHRPQHQHRPNAPFRLHDIRGEVRLQAHGSALAFLHWTDPQHLPQSSGEFNESQVELVCDLGPDRVERIEEVRAGGESVLHVALWPMIEDNEGSVLAQVNTLRLPIPIEKWLTILAAIQGSGTSLVEIPHPALGGPEFQYALSHLRDAKARVDRGDFDEAIGACRRALEGTGKALNLDLRAEALTPRLEGVLEVERAKSITSIITKLRALGSASIHRGSLSTEFLRADAQFVVACTAHAMALLARLFSHDRQSL
ncbi:MAG: hypothetical protein V4503_06470 [Gemmatimonadota bacterium]